MTPRSTQAIWELLRWRLILSVLIEHPLDLVIGETAVLEKAGLTRALSKALGQAGTELLLQLPGDWEFGAAVQRSGRSGPTFGIRNNCRLRFNYATRCNWSF